MRLAVIYSGEFGERFVCNLAFPKLCATFGACGIELCDFCKDYDYSPNVTQVIEVPPPSLPVAEFDFEPFDCDVLVAINVHPDVLLDVVDVAEFRALITPVESPSWLPPGFRKQLAERCEELGIDFAAPKPFCTLEGEGVVGEFVESFGIGKPEFEVELEGNVIRSVSVLRSDPCGSAYYVAKKMRGYVIRNLAEFYMEVHQHQCAYPCMAGMERDAELGVAPFHLAGYLMVYRFARACGVDATGFVPPNLLKFVR
ncbi:MAG: DUF166 family protein [Archaeoglobaceae archaeon]